jgi:hypothetical protein
MIDRMRFLKNPYKAINVVRNSRTFKRGSSHMLYVGIDWASELRQELEFFLSAHRKEGHFLEAGTFGAAGAGGTFVAAAQALTGSVG